MKVVLKKELCEMLAADEKRYDYLKHIDEPDATYDLWVDKQTGEQFKIRKPRFVSMGFNDIKDADVEKLVEVVEREGVAQASWGVTGRTMHSILARQLESRLPQFRFEIGENYECVVSKEGVQI